MITSIINLLKYYFLFFNLKPIEENKIIFKSKHSAIKELKDKNYSFFKIYPIDKNLLFAKIRIDKLKINKNELYYFFSAWIGDEKIKDREYLKYKEDNYDYLISEIQNNIKNNSNYHFSLLNLNRYQDLEELLIQNKDDKIIQEFAIDYIFKLHHIKLFELINTIFSDGFSDYIQQYYRKTIKNLFLYTNYDDLTIYYQELEDTFNDNYEIKLLKEELLKIIQEKNLFEFQLNELNS